jgi:hypothetical protein
MQLNAVAVNNALYGPQPSADGGQLARLGLVLKRIELVFHILGMSAEFE